MCGRVPLGRVASITALVRSWLRDAPRPTTACAVAAFWKPVALWRGWYSKSGAAAPTADPGNVETAWGVELIQELRRTDSVPSIERTPGVCGGEACVAGTRIPVWVLARARQLGGTEEEILADYPCLSRSGLNAAWAYCALHRADIAQQIESNESPTRPSS